MDALIWIMLTAITAMGSALLAFYIMQARLEVVVAKEREALVEARAMMKNHERQLEDRVKMTVEETKRRSFDEFLGDIRVEERHYMRENKSLFTNTKSMILQERLYFRNLPLSNWVEHELTVEQGHTADLANLARAASVFSAQGAAALAGSAAGMAAMGGNSNAGHNGAGGNSNGNGLTKAVPAETSNFGVPDNAFGAAANRRGFGAPRSPSPGVAKVTTMTADHPDSGSIGQMGFAPRLSQSRLVRG